MIAVIFYDHSPKKGTNIATEIVEATSAVRISNDDDRCSKESGL